MMALILEMDGCNFGRETSCLEDSSSGILSLKTLSNMPLPRPSKIVFLFHIEYGMITNDVSDYINLLVRIADVIYSHPLYVWYKGKCKSKGKDKHVPVLF
jgi:hypothetical protein